MKNKKYRDISWLQNQYLILQKDCTEISKLCDCDSETIRYWLIKFKILRRSRTEALKNRWKIKEYRDRMLKLNIGRKHSDEAKRKISKSLTGKVLSKEHREEISRSNIGKILSEKTKQKISKTHMDKKLSEETKKKISESRKGMSFSEEHRKNISKAGTGKVLSLVTRKKMSEAHKGQFKYDKNPNWKGGISFEPYCPAFNNKLKEKIRNRDNRVCQLCGKSEILNGKRLAVHHIDGNKMQGCNSAWYLCALCISCNSKKDTIEKEFLIVSNMKR